MFLKRNENKLFVKLHLSWFVDCKETWEIFRYYEICKKLFNFPTSNKNLNQTKPLTTISSTLFPAVHPQQMASVKWPAWWTHSYSTRSRQPHLPSPKSRLIVPWKKQQVPTIYRQMEWAHRHHRIRLVTHSCIPTKRFQHKVSPRTLIIISVFVSRVALSFTYFHVYSGFLFPRTIRKIYISYLHRLKYVSSPQPLQICGPCGRENWSFMFLNAKRKVISFGNHIAGKFRSFTRYQTQEITNFDRGYFFPFLKTWKTFSLTFNKTFTQ